MSENNFYLTVTRKPSYTTMENFFSFFLNVFSDNSSANTPRLFPIGNTGCAVTLPSAPAVAQFKNHRGNDTWIGQAKTGAITYGFATIVLEQPFANATAAEQALFLFLEELHDSFDVRHTTGLDYGFRHPSNDAVLGMTDYWQDYHGTDYKVRGWTDGKVLCALYVKNIGAASFLDADGYLSSISMARSRNLVQ
jgi:hypothetical protein